MLKAIMENQPIGIIRLSELLNFPQHKVRYSLRILEQEGLIKPSPEGAVTTDRHKEVHDYLKSDLDMMSGTFQQYRNYLRAQAVPTAPLSCRPRYRTPCGAYLPRISYRMSC